MPANTSITVKKNDGTTDQIWTAVQSSGGEKSPAIWRNQSVGIAAAFQPEASISARSNADGSVRRLTGSIDWKQSAVGTDGITRKVNVGLMKIEIVVPQGMPAADLNEFVSQSCNVVASALWKTSMKEGFAPT